MCETLDRLGFTISIHALREEGDTKTVSRNVTALRFLSTPSARRATSSLATTVKIELFLSTPSARRATCAFRISPSQTNHFYPRPPRGGRHKDIEKAVNKMKFLSTPSARRATFYDYWLRLSQPISIHALREEGDLFRNRQELHQLISIHALREEGDVNAYRENKRLMISIHALREEGDVNNRCFLADWVYFYPRPPRGGRPCKHLPSIHRRQISIHALREEGDQQPYKRPDTR